MKGKCELYRHFDADGRLLYIGISRCSWERLIGHKSVSHWFDQIVRVEIERHDTRAAARKAEMAAIKAERPLHNLWTEERKGTHSRRPELEKERQLLIQEAKSKNIQISNLWSVGWLRVALQNAPLGIPYPYQ